MSASSANPVLAVDIGGANLRFQLPVCVATDARQALLAEAVWGLGVNERNFAWATVMAGSGADEPS